MEACYLTGVLDGFAESTRGRRAVEAVDKPLRSAAARTCRPLRHERSDTANHIETQPTVATPASSNNPYRRNLKHCFRSLRLTVVSL